jgi:hypothetical protein
VRYPQRVSDPRAFAGIGDKRRKERLDAIEQVRAPVARRMGNVGNTVTSGRLTGLCARLRS